MACWCGACGRDSRGFNASSIIEEVLNSMSEEIRDDMSFEEMLKATEPMQMFTPERS